MCTILFFDNVNIADISVWELFNKKLLFLLSIRATITTYYLLSVADNYRNDTTLKKFIIPKYKTVILNNFKQ